VSQIRPGTVVQLKSGGPFMTVTDMEDNQAWTEWFDKDEKLQKGKFLVTSIAVVDSLN
jgi:uncharacterized protein YodC (DUF2158 family)